MAYSIALEKEYSYIDGYVREWSLERYLPRTLE
jgi:hypothetical protein